MDFALTSDQSMLQDAVRRALARTASLEHVRAVAEQRAAMDIDGWRALRELGAPGILIEAEYGGLGLSLLDAALVVEELGRCAAPVPFLGTAVLAPLALREAGSDSQRVEWLPRLASGECIAGVAIAESIAGARDGAGVTCESGRLNGRTLFAVDAAAANLFIVGDRRGALYLVRADADGVSRTNLVHVDATRPLSELRFERNARRDECRNLFVQRNEIRKRGSGRLAAGRSVHASVSLCRKPNRTSGGRCRRPS